VEVIRRCDRERTGDLIVRLPDDTRCALPAWMLDESLCAAMVESSTPVLPLTTLRCLIRLLDLQRPADANSGHDKQPLSKIPDAIVDPPTTARSGFTDCDPGSSAPTVSGLTGRDAQEPHSPRTKGPGQ